MNAAEQPKTFAQPSIFAVVDGGFLRGLVVVHVRDDVGARVHVDDAAVRERDRPDVTVTATGTLMTEPAERLVEAVVLLVDHDDVLDQPGGSGNSRGRDGTGDGDVRAGPSCRTTTRGSARR